MPPSRTFGSILAIYQSTKVMVRMRSFQNAFLVSCISGSLSGILYFLDKDRGYTFINKYMPEPIVFNVFIVFASLVAAFRTYHALGRYSDAASYLHSLCGMWFDSVSTLIAFCRVAKASDEEVEEFQQTMIRLVSMVSALCFESLQRGNESPAGKDLHKYRIDVLGSEELDIGTLASISASPCKVEAVFQMIQQLVIDGMDSGVLSIAPPILSRAFQELGAGLMTYHEAKKLACVPLPYADGVVTTAILMCLAVFLPFVMATYTRGVFSSFFYSFFGMFLLCFTNGVADSLANPFKQLSRSLDASVLQRELNERLLQLMAQARDPTPKTNMSWRIPAAGHRGNASGVPFHNWSKSLTKEHTRLSPVDYDHIEQHKANDFSNCPRTRLHEVSPSTDNDRRSSTVDGTKSTPLAGMESAPPQAPESNPGSFTEIPVVCVTSPQSSRPCQEYGTCRPHYQQVVWCSSLQEPPVVGNAGELLYNHEGGYNLDCGAGAYMQPARTQAMSWHRMRMEPTPTVVCSPSEVEPEPLAPPEPSPPLPQTPDDDDDSGANSPIYPARTEAELFQPRGSGPKAVVRRSIPAVKRADSSPKSHRASFAPTPLGCSDGTPTSLGTQGSMVAVSTTRLLPAIKNVWLVDDASPIMKGDLCTTGVTLRSAAFAAAAKRASASTPRAHAEDGKQGTDWT